MKNHFGVVIVVLMLAIAGVLVSQTQETEDFSAGLRKPAALACEGSKYPACGGYCPDDTTCLPLDDGASPRCICDYPPSSLPSSKAGDCPDKFIEDVSSVLCEEVADFDCDGFPEACDAECFDHGLVFSKRVEVCDVEGYTNVICKTQRICEREPVKLPAVGGVF